MKKILVTGASGFVGNHTLPLLLARGYEVHAVTSGLVKESHDQLIWHHCNLLDVTSIEKLCHEVQGDALLHLAWITDPANYWESPANYRWLQSTIQLFDSFVSNGGTRIICTGTCAEYDWRYGTCTENQTPCLASSAYASCKLALSSILESFSKNQGVSSAWGRIFFLFGENEHPQRLVPYIINNLLHNEPVVCKNGHLLRDFLYVGDVAGALVSLLSSDTQGVVNIASGQALKISELAITLADKLDRRSLIHDNENAQNSDDAPLVVASTDRLLQEVKWSPTLSLDQSLDLSIEWWKRCL